jgi:mRNA interferase RelE/StbE
MAYELHFKASAQKSLERIQPSIQSRILEKSMALAVDPRPAGCAKLKGSDNFWRIRTGDYRIIYLIDDKRHIVDIRIIAHRREVYRDL